MTALEKAALLLNQHVLSPARAQAIAQRLADAGLLAPDLPESDFIAEENIHEWADGHIWVEDGSGYIYTSRFAGILPSRAEEYALALLAAAKHAERNQP